MKLVKNTLIAVMLIFAILFLAFYFNGGKHILRPPQYQGPISDHFNGTIFYNKFNKREHRAGKFWQMKLTHQFQDWPEWIENNAEIDRTIVDKVSEDKAKITFINHATILIQTASKNILTDPIWSDRCSPFKFAGPKRVHAPGIDINKLPKIDIILISHDHYDHLDINTLKKLQNKFQSKIYAGLGVNKVLQDNGINNIFILDWWDEVKIDEDITIHYTPAEHWSARGIRDVNTTLWGGYFITTPKFKIFFAGDTAFSPIFEDIKNKLGPPDISFLPIGSFLPRWFMKPSHMSPSEAIEAHEALSSKKSVGIHWGTFQLSAESRERPLIDLNHAKKLKNLDNEDFITLEPGESFMIQK